MITEERKNTAYCGLYCRDCIPSNSRLFELADEFENHLSDLNFDKYAELKSDYDETFRDYSTFLNVLKKIKGLKCENGCFQGPWSVLGCHNDCIIRKCALKKRIAGCWECPENPGCSNLERLRKYHPNYDEHLSLIKKYGIDNWADRRKSHYRWQINSPKR